MKWILGLGATIFGVSIIFVVGLFIWGIGVTNKSTVLINQIKAKQEANTADFDNMKKKISQVAQVSEMQMSKLKEIFVENSQARTPKGGGALALWIKEAVPNIDTKTFENLQNIIVATRDSWTMRQKELIDYKREHDNMIDTIPSCWILSFAGHKKQEITIVTSTATREAFTTGKDDDDKVFGK